MLRPLLGTLILFVLMTASWFALKWTGDSRWALAILLGPMALYGIPAVIIAIKNAPKPPDD